jgi:hypothetical protein
MFNLSIKFKPELQTNRFIDFHFDIQTKNQKIIKTKSAADFFGSIESKLL